MMWLRREARDFTYVDLARRVPRIVGGLHAQPHVGAIPEGCAEAGRDLGRDRLALAQGVIQVLAGGAAGVPEPSLAPPPRRGAVLPARDPGVGGAPGWSSVWEGFR